VPTATETGPVRSRPRRQCKNPTKPKTTHTRWTRPGGLHSLYNLRARNYDPTLGRFTQPDPLEALAAQPYTSAYAYANNQPLTLIDPLGLRAIPGIGRLPANWDQLTPAQKAAWIAHQLGPDFVDAQARRGRGPSLGDMFGEVTGDPLGTWKTGRNQVPVGAQIAVGGVILVSGGFVVCYLSGVAPCVVAGSTTLGPTAERAGEATDYATSKINITERGLDHVLERHVADGALSAGKSVFYDNVIITRLIADAAAVTPVPQDNGNLAYVVDAARVVGIDRASGGATRIYTVITTAGGELVTAFPGLPAG
jgi:RHS repeat-associated protein